ncbi:MAG: acyl-CoA desaturase [Planctomycetaceae bacterium]
MPSTLLPPPVDRISADSVPAFEVATSPESESAVFERPREVTSVTERDALRASFDKGRLRWNNIDWTVAVWMVLMHAGCIAAPFFFSWSAVIVCLVLYYLTCSIGVCLGYHRYLTHRSMKLAKPVEFGVMAMGVISGEGTPLTWSAVHRLHHQESDTDHDPHSPTDGGWWAHLLWLFVRRTPRENEILYKRYVPELIERPMMQFFERTQAFWLTAVGVSLGAAGYFTGGLGGVASFLLWGMCVRMVVAYHSTWFVNSATHIWGYRNYETRDKSKNLWWVALFAFGEGWHNNHHAHATVAPAGHRWWEVDVTWWAIKALRACGLAWDVNDRIPERNAEPAADPQ